MNYVKFSKHLYVKKLLFNANVFIDLVQSIPEKPALSMTDLLNSSSKHPPRIVITSTSTIKSCVRSPASASSVIPVHGNLVFPIQTPVDAFLNRPQVLHNVPSQVPVQG